MRRRDFIVRVPEAAIVLPSAMFWNERVRIVFAIAKHRLPAVYPEQDYADDGGLFAYGPIVSDNFRGAADYVDKILKGAKPGDLPIVQPSRFKLIINAKTARAMQFSIPPSLLARADEIVE